MSRGDLVEVTGILDAERHGMVLRETGGGIWQLGPSRTARRLIGQHVHVRGAHGGFDEIVEWRIVGSDGVIVKDFDVRWKAAGVAALLAGLALAGVLHVLR